MQAVKLIRPAIGSPEESVIVTFDNDSQYQKMPFFDRFKDILYNEFMNQMREVVSNPLNFIWPWKTYWDNLWDGITGVMDALSRGIYEGESAIKVLIGLSQEFIKSVMGKTNELLKSGKKKAKQMIDDAKEENKTTTVDTSGTGPIKPPPIVVDTSGSQIDTSGEYQ